jgi:hypothetical protein
MINIYNRILHIIKTIDYLKLFNDPISITLLLNNHTNLCPIFLFRSYVFENFQGLREYKIEMEMIGNDFLRKIFFCLKDVEDNSLQFFKRNL